MSNTNFLKSELEKELNNRESNNKSNLINIPLDENQSIHVYNGEGNYTSEQIGEILFLFNNESAWLWNKNIELELNISDKYGENKGIDMDDIKTNNEYGLINKVNDNKFLIENIKTKFSLSVKLNIHDKISWKFCVLNNNSIDFKVYYQIDYLKILKIMLDKNVENEKVDILTKEIEQKNNEILNFKNEIIKHKKNINEMDIELNKLKINAISFNDVIKQKDKNIENVNKEINEYIKKYDLLNVKSIRDNSFIEALKTERDNLKNTYNSQIEELDKTLKEEIIKHNNIVNANKQDFLTVIKNEKENFLKKINILNTTVIDLQNMLADEKSKTIMYNNDLKKSKEIIEQCNLQNKKITIELEDTAKHLTNEFNCIMDRYNDLVNINNILKKELNFYRKKYGIFNTKFGVISTKFNVNLAEFNEKFKNVVVKRHIYILENKLSDAIKQISTFKNSISQLVEKNNKLLEKEEINKYINVQLNNLQKEHNKLLKENTNLTDLKKEINSYQQIVKELTEENMKLLKINHVNKYNENKLKMSLNKAKMKINKEVNSNRTFDQKLKLIKDNFINDMQK